MDSHLHAGRAAFIVTAVCAFVSSAMLSAGEPPSIERFFPPGGQIGTSVEAEIKGKPGDTTLQVWSDRDELQIKAADDNKSATVIVPDDAKPGLHWLRFHNEFGTTEPRPFVVGLISEVTEQEPNNQPDEAQQLEAPTVTVNGILGRTGDVDVYRMDVPAGRTLVASMLASRELGSPMDAVLQLLDSNGTVVAQNDDDHGMDPLIAFDVPSAGTWYLRTFAFPSTPNSTIRLAGGSTYVYRLTVTTGPFVDHTLPAVVHRRGTADMTVRGWNLTEEKLRVAVPWNKSSELLLLEDFAVAHAVPFADREVCIENQSPSFQVNSAVTGCIGEPKEVDAYTFTGIKGQSLKISVAARSLYSLLDPVLKVTTVDGKDLAEADDRSGSDLDGEVSITVPDDRPLTVTVTDRFQSGGWRHFYVLHCEEPKPQFHATVGATSYTLTQNATSEIPVTIHRSGGFSESITVQLKGLPDGVTSNAVISEPEGDTAAAVTLTLTRSESAAAFCGPVQIECRSTKRQWAEAAIPNSVRKTGDIWLTVAAP